MKLSIGQRVRVYDALGLYTGTIVKILPACDPSIIVICGGVEMSPVFPQQCRRLKPRVKRVPRECWVWENEWNGMELPDAHKTDPDRRLSKIPIIRFREVID